MSVILKLKMENVSYYLVLLYGRTRTGPILLADTALHSSNIDVTSLVTERRRPCSHGRSLGTNRVNGVSH